jgi:hypothetical protein
MSLGFTVHARDHYDNFLCLIDLVSTDYFSSVLFTFQTPVCTWLIRRVRTPALGLRLMSTTPLAPPQNPPRPTTSSTPRSSQQNLHPNIGIPRGGILIPHSILGTSQIMWTWQKWLSMDTGGIGGATISIMRLI